MEFILEYSRGYWEDYQLLQVAIIADSKEAINKELLIVRDLDEDDIFVKIFDWSFERSDLFYKHNDLPRYKLYTLKEFFEDHLPSVSRGYRTREWGEIN